MQLSGMFLDILLLALVVGLLFKLRRILGRRAGPTYDSSKTHPVMEGEIPKPARGQAEETAGAGADDAPILIDSPARSGLAAMARRDPSFMPETFFRGALKAYAMIVTAFAKGEKETLKRLLAHDVYERFASVVEARAAEGQTASVEISQLLEARITSAELKDDRARIGMLFRSKQIVYLKDSEGRVIEGDPNQPQEKGDSWIFSRAMGADSPSWALAATSAAA